MLDDLVDVGAIFTIVAFGIGWFISILLCGMIIEGLINGTYQFHMYDLISLIWVGVGLHVAKDIPSDGVEYFTSPKDELPKDLKEIKVCHNQK